MMPVLPSAFARRISAVVRTGVIKSLLSANQRFHCAMWRIVATNPSQIEHVQFAAVNPPLRISANTSRLHFETTRPSITVSESCKRVMQSPESFAKPPTSRAGALRAAMLASSAHEQEPTFDVIPKDDGIAIADDHLLQSGRSAVVQIEAVAPAIRASCAPVYRMASARNP
jgi:hypothetical protein